MKKMTRRLLDTLFGVVGIPLLISSAFSQSKPVIQSSFVSWLGNTSTSYEVVRSDGLKTYYLKTDAPLRDNVPVNKEVQIIETASLPFIRTQSSMFDSLFALAMQEVKLSSVNLISDGSFDDAQCDCFETGEKWRYVWTRDTAYATNLGLAALDPVRAMNSLLFKISGFRNKSGEEQIVQDTGSGGSWPISTDRIVWALGAAETLNHLPSQSTNYRNFLARGYTALKNTVLTDRYAIFDQGDGLYTGEQSFLDWREQSYPEWTASKVVHIGMSKSLSTNVVYYMTLNYLAGFARELNDQGSAEKFENWARDLKQAINEHFWDGTSYRSVKVTYLDQRPPKYYDLLGISLAVISGVASKEQATSALNSYPQTQVGAPVIWPQRQDIAIYHNRAIWPFVTAYALKAAKMIEDPYLITSFVRSLIIGPAQNLSHMENYEFTTLRNYYADGRFSGPVVNSRRQLWSVAGYAGMVLDVVFGKEVKSNAIRFSPALTLSLRKDLFGQSKNLELNNFQFQGKKLKVVLDLPVQLRRIDENADGLLSLTKVTLNGKKIDPQSWINVSALSDDSIEIRLTLTTPKSTAPSQLQLIAVPENNNRWNSQERQFLYAPRTPSLAPVGLSDNSPLLSFHSTDPESINYHIYKNGNLIAKTTANYYLDQGHPLDVAACYSITAVYDSGNESFPSEPFCYWPISSIQHYPVNGLHVRNLGGSQFANASGRVYLHEWGNPNQKLILEKVTPTQTGVFAIQVEYANVAPINTGITCGVKKVTVTNEKTGEVVKNAVLTMPHYEGSNWTDSNFIPVEMNQGTTYSVIIEDFFNMSYLNHFTTYKYRGGKSGMYNMMNVTEIKILHLGD